VNNRLKPPQGPDRKTVQRSPRKKNIMPDAKVVITDSDMFVVVDGIRVARRGYPGTPQARSWVSIEPGWEVIDGENLNSILIRCNDVSVH
jgi:hypothetical protein